MINIELPCSLMKENICINLCQVENFSEVSEGFFEVWKEWSDKLYFLACRTRPTISTQLIDRGQSEDKRMASWKVQLFPKWVHHTAVPLLSAVHSLYLVTYCLGQMRWFILRNKVM